MIVFDQHSDFFNYINAALGVKFDPSNSRCIASVTEDAKILGVTMYSRFTPWNCELSVASSTPRFIDRGYLRAVFRYPFEQLGLTRITAIIEDGNSKAIELDRRLGFIEEATLKSWYGDKDGIVLRMLKDECKWL